MTGRLWTALRAATNPTLKLGAAPRILGDGEAPCEVAVGDWGSAVEGRSAATHGGGPERAPGSRSLGALG